MRAARGAGVWVFGAGLESQQASVVATDRTVTDGPYPETKEVIGGFSVVDVAGREQALEWAARASASLVDVAVVGWEDRDHRGQSLEGR